MANKSSPHGGFFNVGTVSHGTLRTQDLLRAFADEYERLLPFNGARLANEAREIAEAVENYPDNGPHDEAADVLAELEDALGEIAAREGDYYFGAIEGDGADFGFWATESVE